MSRVTRCVLIFFEKSNLPPYQWVRGHECASEELLAWASQRQQSRQRRSLERWRRKWDDLEETVGAHEDELVEMAQLFALDAAAATGDTYAAHLARQVTAELEFERAGTPVQGSPEPEEVPVEVETPGDGAPAPSQAQRTPSATTEGVAALVSRHQAEEERPPPEPPPRQHQTRMLWGDGRRREESTSEAVGRRLGGWITRGRQVQTATRCRIQRHVAGAPRDSSFLL